MKIFAILTASLMASAGGAYYFTASDGGCPFGGCPVAKTGGCCQTESAAAQPDCCQLPCPACENDCRECCAVCEDCCVAGATVVAPAPTAAKAKKAGCCVSGECNDASNSTSAVTAAAVVAGATVK